MRKFDPRSAAAETYRRWYRTTRWRRLRRAQLLRMPHCTRCAAMGRLTPATIVDHIRPHKGDPALFWDPANHDSLCTPHHDATKQREEHGRRQAAVGTDGWPEEAGRGFPVGSGAPREPVNAFARRVAN